MIPWVNVLLREWARFARRDAEALGYPSMTWEARAMRDYGRRSKERPASMRPAPVLRVVTDAEGNPVKDDKGRTRVEAIKPMVPQAKPKQSGYNNWDAAFMWPPQIERIDTAVERLPKGMKVVIAIRYLDPSPGTARDRAREAGISNRSFYELLDQAHVRLAGELED